MRFDAVRSWCFFVLTLVACGDAAAQKEPAPAPTAKPAPKPLQVQVYPVTRVAAAETIDATGELVPNEQVEIVAELSRRLTTIHVAEGDPVTAGQLLFELDRADLEAQLARLQVQARYGRTALGRRDALADSGAVSKQERDDARQRVDEAGAAAKEVEVQLDKTRILAPFAGTLGLRKASVGAWVGPTRALTTLYDVSKLKVDFRVPERYAGRIQPRVAGSDAAVGQPGSAGPSGNAGQPFTFRVAGRGETFEGHVIALEPQIEPDTRSLVVRGLVEAPAGLVPGTFVDIDLVLSTRQTMFIPAIALQPSPTGTRVFVVRDGKALELPVEVGRREPERIEIVKGLSEGDRVIVTNLLRVRNGVPVVEVDRGDGP